MASHEDVGHTSLRASTAAGGGSIPSLGTSTSTALPSSRPMWWARKSPSLLLSKLTPYTVAIGLVRSGRRIGIAYSDPYLSCATPLASLPARATPWEVAAVLQGIPVGVVVLGLPPSRSRASSDDAGALRSMAMHLQRQAGSPLVAVQQCVWRRQVSADEVRAQCADNALWQEIASAVAERPRGGGGAAAPAVLAAISLQDLLDEEMGGWPNMFG